MTVLNPEIKSADDIYSVEYDIDSSDLLCSGRIVLTKDFSLILFADGEHRQKEEFRCDFNEIKELSISSHIGCASLEAEMKNGDSVRICRFTQSCLNSVSEFIKAANYYIETGEITEIDIEKTNKMNQDNENVKYNNNNKLNLKNIEKNLKTVKKKIKKLQKNSFMTGVGLTKNKKEPIVVKKLENDPMLNDINNQINAILKNIDDEGDEQKVRKTIKHLKDSADFKEMIKEIDDYRDEIHEEFDEVKYLIKFADNTHKLIDRHKNVMTNIFRGAGLRPTKNLENEEERAKMNKGNKKYSSKSTGKYEIDNYKNYNDYNDYDNEPYYKDGYYYRQAREEDMNLGEVFDKLKAINKVKDNLSNIQDDFLGYHQNLKTKMKRINGGK